MVGEMNQTNPIDQEVLERIIKEVFEKIDSSRSSDISPEVVIPKESGVSINPKRIPVGVSVRHVHICKKDLEKLFGPGAEVHAEREQYKPGDFAAKETVSLIGPKMMLLERVRTKGPTRERTQVELDKKAKYVLAVVSARRVSGE